MTEINVFLDGEKIGEAALIPGNWGEADRWECHPEPVASTPWFYRDTAKEAISGLLGWHFEANHASNMSRLGDDVLNQENLNPDPF